MWITALRRLLSFNFAKRPASRPRRWLARVAVYMRIGRWQFSWTADRGSRYPEDFEPYVLRKRWRLTPRVHAMLLRFYERPEPIIEKAERTAWLSPDASTGHTSWES
jgi:hypothetical protein